MKTVKYDNRLNKIKTSTLTESELDIFITLIYKIQEENALNLELSFSELKSLANVKSRLNERLFKAIKNMSTKLIQMNQSVETEQGDILIFTLFNQLQILKTESLLKVEVNKNFQYLVNNITKNFTYYSLKEFLSLNSKYSKTIYRLVHQYKSTGWIKILLDDFNEMLGTHNYTTTNLNKEVISRINKELKTIFKNFKISKLGANGKVAKGVKTHTLLLTWDVSKVKSKSENISNKLELDRVKADKKASERIKRTMEQLESNTKTSTTLIKTREQVINESIANNVSIFFLNKALEAYKYTLISEEEYTKIKCSM